MNSLLFTGASGFLGNEIRPLLSTRYEIETVGLTPVDNYKVDLAKKIPALAKK